MSTAYIRIVNQGNGYSVSVETSKRRMHLYACSTRDEAMEHAKTLQETYTKARIVEVDK